MFMTENRHNEIVGQIMRNYEATCERYREEIRRLTIELNEAKKIADNMEDYWKNVNCGEEDNK